MHFHTWYWRENDWAFFWQILDVQNASKWQYIQILLGYFIDFTIGKKTSNLYGFVMNLITSPPPPAPFKVRVYAGLFNFVVHKLGDLSNIIGISKTSLRCSNQVINFSK